MPAKNTRTATIKVDADVRKAIKGMNDVAKKVSEAEAHMLRWGESSEKVMAQMDSAGVASSKNFTALGIGLDKVKTGLGALVGPAKAAGVAVAAIGFAAVKVAELADESLKAQAVFNNLKFSIAGAAEASKGMVDNATLAEAQVRALQLGAVDTQKGFEELAEAGSILGLVMQGDAAKGVDDLATALSRNSPLLLDNLGITLTLSQAKEEYAEQLGKTVDSLTDAEEAEAFRTIGLQKALAAAREKNIEDSKALEIKRLEIAAINARAELLGAEESAQLRLNSALESMGDEITALDIDNYGTDLRKVEKAMERYGISIEEAGGRAKVQAEIQRKANQVLLDQAAAAEAAAEAEAKRAAAMAHAEQMAQVNADLANLQHAVNLQVAEFGAGSEEAAAQAFALAGAQLEVARTAAMAANATEDEAKALEAAEKAFEVADARLRGASKASRRGRGGRRRREEDLEKEAAKERAAMFAREVKIAEQLIAVERRRGKVVDDLAEGLLRMQLAEAKAIGDMEARREAEHGLAMLQFDTAERNDALAEEHFARKVARMEREIEMKQALGQETEFLERRLAQVQLERATAEADGELQEQIVHAERLRRIERENEARERYHQAELERLEQERKEREALERTIEAGVRTTVQGLAQSTEAAILAKDNKGAAFAAEVSEFAGSRAKILAIDAATHFALAAAYAIALNPVKAAAELAAGAKSSAAAAAMGALAAATGAAAGGSGGADSVGGGIGGGGPSAPTRPTSANGAPVSPLEQNGQPAPQGAAGDGGQVVNIHVAGSFIDSGGQLQELMKDAGANGGRNMRAGLG